MHEELATPYTRGCGALIPWFVFSALTYLIILEQLEDSCIHEGLDAIHM
jgi:hypothetical protein